jgi:type I restriction enzyme S subunit
MGDQNGGLYQPEFPDHWERHPLYNLARWVNGLAFREINFSPTGWPVIKIAEVKNGVSEQTKFTQQSFDDSVRVRRGDLIFSWSGQPETSINAFWWRGTEGWLNQHLFLVTPAGDVDRTFFYYLLRYLNPNFVGIARNKQTTGLGHVTRRDLETIEAALPPLSEQRAIAEVLGALDDKIEANRRAEKLAHDLLRGLYVQLKEQSSDADVPLMDVVEFVFGEPFDSSFFNTEQFGRPLIRIRDLKTFVPQFSTTEVRDRETVVVPGDILVGMDAEFRPTIWCGELGLLNQRVCLAKPLTGSAAFTVKLLEEPLAHLESFKTGTTVSHLNKSDLEQIRVVLPTPNALERFDWEAEPLRVAIVALQHENRSIAALRDALLPQLLSGEMRVRDADELAGEAV